MVEYLHKKLGNWLALALVCLLVTTVIFTGCKAEPAGPRELKCCIITPPGNSMTLQIMQFADDVAEYTNGAVTIRVYSPGEIAEITDYAEMCKRGDIDLIGTAPAYNASMFPVNLQLQSYQSLSKGPDMTYYVWKGLNEEVPEIEAEFENNNMKQIFRLFLGNTYVITKKPIHGMADLQGLRLRVGGDVYSMKLCAAVGAVGSP